MPRKGPPPTPVSVQRARGTFRPGRHGPRAVEPVAPPGILLAPDWMTESQRALWDRTLAAAPANLLRPIDAGVLGVWVIAADMHTRAAQAQNRLDAGAARSLLVKDKAGAAVPSPYLKIINRCADVMLRAGGELGFGPGARSRLASPQETPPIEDAGWARLRLLQGGKEKPPAKA